VVRTALENRQASADSVELRWLLVQACHGQGHVHDAVAAVETALAIPNLAVEDAGRLHGMSGLDNFFLGRLDAAEAGARRALRIGDTTGNPLATGYGLMALGAVRYTRGYLDEALALSGRILAIYENGIGSDQFDPYVLRAHCLIELDRLTEAEAALRQAIGHSRRVHGPYLSPNLVAKARLYLLDGRWDDVIAEYPADMAELDAFGYAPVLHSIAALIGIHRGTFLPDRTTSWAAAVTGNCVRGSKHSCTRHAATCAGR
jgi:tetratricopeptide (TPR) repeat protein